MFRSLLEFRCCRWSSVTRSRPRGARRRRPAAAAQSNPAVDLRLEDPAVRSVLEDNPTKPAELVRAITVLVDLDRAELARPLLAQTARSESQSKALAALADEFDTALFMKLAGNDQLAPQGAELADAVLSAAAKGRTRSGPARGVDRAAGRSERGHSPPGDATACRPPRGGRGAAVASAGRSPPGRSSSGGPGRAGSVGRRGGRPAVGRANVEQHGDRPGRGQSARAGTGHFGHGRPAGRGLYRRRVVAAARGGQRVAGADPGSSGHRRTKHASFF